MKKKRGRKRSSIQTSKDSGKEYWKKNEKYARLQMRLDRGEAQITGLNEKVSHLMQSLVEGDLPNSLVIQNLMKSHRGLANEIAEIKIFVAKKAKIFTEVEERAMRSENYLRRLDAGMDRIEDRLKAISAALTIGKKEKKKQRDGNKGKDG